MSEPPIPDDEEERLEDLANYHILDTPPEEAFDRIADMAVRIFDVPIATVTLVDRDRQWFKACRGIGVRETPRQDAFCAHTILSDDIMVVPDASQDERFEDNPFVTDEPGIRFYAGAPLVTPEGHHIGDVCIMDFEPRFHLPDSSRETLGDLADIVVDELEMRRIDRNRRWLDEKLHSVVDITSDALVLETPEHEIERVNASFEAMFGYESEEIRGQPIDDLFEGGLERTSEWPTSLDTSSWRRTTCRHRDGSSIEVPSRRRCLRDERDECIGYVTIWRNRASSISNPI